MNVFNINSRNFDDTQITTLDAKFGTLSNKYKLVPTKSLADKFKSMGFVVAQYSEKSVRNAKRQGYQKHQVRLEHPTLLTSSHSDVKLQLVITNSHDGSSSFSVRLGIYRLVCSNGLMVGRDFEAIRLRHTGSIIEQVDEAVERMVAQTKKLDQMIEKMKNRILTKEEQNQFMEKAVKLRYPKKDSDDVAMPIIRREDQGDDLFTVYNRVQESLIRGSTVRTDNNRFRQARALRSISLMSKINEELFDLASEMVQAA